MAASSTMETVLIVGVLGAGGYLFYEYSKYSSAMNTVAQANGLTASSLESILPFFTWLSFNWGGSGSGTTQQQNLYAVIQSALSGTTIPLATTQAPGTTSSTQTTSVSASPGTTATITASSSPSVSPLTPARTYAPAGSGLAPLASSRLPAGAITLRSRTLTGRAGITKTKI